MNATVVELQHLVKTFGSTRAVDDVSFEVGRGEIVALLGPSGCGKTTTLRAIAGFEQPESGRILIGGEDVARRRPYERSIGFVFQDYALFPHMTVAQNIAFGVKHRGAPRREIPGRTAEVLEQVQLPGLGHRRPSQLSGGQQQRVALARALVTRPDVMLLDEPLSNLDAKLRLELRLELRRILGASGCTSIIVTHDQEEAMGLADRIVLMNQGRIEQIDAPTRLYERPVSRFAAEFIGHANWFEGRLTATGNGSDTVETPAGPILVQREGFANGPVSVCVRPERLALDLPAEAAVGSSCFAGTVEAVDIIGADIRTWVRLADGTLVQSLDKNVGRPRPAVGSTVSLNVAPTDCIVLPVEGSPP